MDIYKKACNFLLKGLSERTADVIERRFGLKGSEPETLELIGQGYHITRERVRQIEYEGISQIKEKIEYQEPVFKSLLASLEKMGGVKKESTLLKDLGGDKLQNHAKFLLSVGAGFKREAESDNFHAFWSLGEEVSAKARKIIQATVAVFNDEASPMTLDQITKKLQEKNDVVNGQTLSNYLEVSKDIEKGYDNRIGLSHWVEIKPKGVKDKAYIVFKKEHRPLHFTQVASCISQMHFSSMKKAHVATVHNELIKDNRFVLIGRGVYALKEWGYEPGVVRDVIIKVITNSGKSLAKEEIIKKVLEKRIVKPNTVFLNLQNKDYFAKGGDGRYTVRKEQIEEA